MNLTEELENSFVDEPAHRPVEQRIAAGHRLVVRRRLTTGVGVTAAALVLCGSAFAIAGAGDDPSPAPGPQFATDSTPSPEPADPPAAPVDGGGPEGDLEWGRAAAYLGTDGTVHIKPSWAIAEQIDEPSGPGSVAVEVTQAGKRQWFMWDGDGGEISALGRPGADGAPDPDYASFAGWVADLSNAAGQPRGEGRR